MRLLELLGSDWWSCLASLHADCKNVLKMFLVRSLIAESTQGKRFLSWLEAILVFQNNRTHEITSIPKECVII